MINFRYLFEDSFHRVCLNQDKSAEFFTQFYHNFVDHNPAIKEKFVNTDMAVQQDMLKMSFIYLIDFFQFFEENQRLKDLASVHSKMDRDITGEMYDTWLEALLVTLKQVLPDVDDNTTLAWRVMLAPGIAYMKHKSNDSAHSSFTS